MNSQETYFEAARQAFGGSLWMISQTRASLSSGSSSMKQKHPSSYSILWLHQYIEEDCKIQTVFNLGHRSNVLLPCAVGRCRNSVFEAASNIQLSSPGHASMYTWHSVAFWAVQAAGYTGYLHKLKNLCLVIGKTWTTLNVKDFYSISKLSTSTKGIGLFWIPFTRFPWVEWLQNSSMSHLRANLEESLFFKIKWVNFSVEMVNCRKSKTKMMCLLN